MAKAEATAEDKRLKDKIENGLYWAFDRQDTWFEIGKINVTDDMLVVVMKTNFVEGRTYDLIAFGARKKQLFDPKLCGKPDRRAGIHPTAMRPIDLAAVRAVRALFKIAKGIKDGTAVTTETGVAYANLKDDGDLKYSA